MLLTIQNISRCEESLNRRNPTLDITSALPAIANVRTLAFGRFMISFSKEQRFQGQKVGERKQWLLLTLDLGGESSMAVD